VALIVRQKVGEGAMVGVVLSGGRIQEPVGCSARQAGTESVQAETILALQVAVHRVEAAAAEDAGSVKSGAAVASRLHLDDAAHLPAVFCREAGDGLTHLL